MKLVRKSTEEYYAAAEERMARRAARSRIPKDRVVPVPKSVGTNATGFDTDLIEATRPKSSDSP